MTEQVKQMFSRIAPRYDRMNTILSFGIHYLWRKKAVRLSGVREGDSVLDCATGTGDLAFEFSRKTGPGGSVTAIDFSGGMIALAREKLEKKGGNIDFSEGDVLQLGFPDGAFDCSSISFGIRNVDSPLAGLSEMARVVKPGGKVIVIEFGQPKGLLSLPYKFYARFVMPLLGRLFAGDKDAYTYLPVTASKFPCRNDFISIMEQTGRLTDCRFYSLSSGIAFIYAGIVKQR